MNELHANPKVASPAPLAHVRLDAPATAPFPIFTESADRLVHAMQGRLTNGVSPASMVLAYLDWLVHLANSPGKMGELVQNAAAKSLPLLRYAQSSALGLRGIDPFIEPLAHDSRFASPQWQTFPFDVLHQSFLYAEQWWHYATTGVRGVSRHHEAVVEFAARQLLDMMSPSNFLGTNPDVLKATVEQGGQNLARGMENFLDLLHRQMGGPEAKPSADGFVVGRDVACTPGKVVLRNRLIELIQYAPATGAVHPEPVLIVPAWIMKYYILDLSPCNSLVRWLVERGHTVFMISWKNPDAEDRDLGMSDYRRLGVMAALDAISAIVPGVGIHAAGYCLGGTLLSIAAAGMAKDGDHRLASLTLLAAQTDFEDAGEILLFIDESQVTYLEDMMWNQGYLDTKQMAGAFQLLRSNDLIWSQMVRRFLLGETPHGNDLMAWNADATRMPYRMHTEYLQRLFLRNELAKGRYTVDGRPVALTDIRAPICAVGTTKDHVAPWRSVYKIGLLTDTDVTFILAKGGHNAGIISEPGHAGRSYQISTHKDLDHYVDADSWEQVTPRREGSWWEAWQAWLAERSGPRMPPPPMGGEAAAPLMDAPGLYVLMR
ncbi:poly-beta-hydroxybutyrate polymerase domain-containing protein [Paramagnetospirillum caucaseum]|uniref:Poly-beta-hydroxybutyrate polymerase domain-containing protein n=1 Tax=Paramagnetospirillum caucaseum TaxID=1244869 RepID=M2YAP6_9PROT|nr:alpha/beta fold hydrolase [Paramagnetospirillum caucaseum]EME70076.1 poly-beta-hydroxybutyrate polymerase domain-containing protein [Paramagnetospirillum caucaseum]